MCPMAVPAGMGASVRTGTAPVTAYQDTLGCFVNMVRLKCIITGTADLCVNMI